VFAIAWRRIDVVPDPPEDLLWLYGTARRVVSNHLRRRWRRARIDVRRIAESAHFHDGDEDPLRDRLRSLIESLRPADREVLRLVLWEELTHEQVATVLGCSVNAVAVRVHRAKQRLSEQLALAPPGDSSAHQVVPPPQNWRTNPS
jgi:RNA polymerase sigma-70 factor (ECF subfamily)